jgi:hypothetical protein
MLVLVLVLVPESLPAPSPREYVPAPEFATIRVDTSPPDAGGAPSADVP